jgi:hypothetical protein
MNKTICLAAFLGLIVACQNEDTRNIRDYYFPVTELRDGIVYGYDMTGLQGSVYDSVSDYWYYRGIVRDSGTFLSSTNYAATFEVGQMVLERITESGAVAREFSLFDADSATRKAVPMRVRVDNPDMFPFKVRDSLGVFLFGISFWSPEDTTARQYMIRNRRYLGDGPDFMLEGKSYPTIRFRVDEALGNEQEGTAEIPVHGEEWYAKGIGLVYAHKVYGHGGQLKHWYRLRERIPMSELERRAKGLF